jgi:hypothetical protein
MPCLEASEVRIIPVPDPIPNPRPPGLKLLSRNSASFAQEISFFFSQQAGCGHPAQRLATGTGALVEAGGGVAAGLLSS